MQYDFLQLSISSPLIHALGDLSPAPPHRDSHPGPQIERQTTYQLSYPSPPLDSILAGGILCI